LNDMLWPRTRCATGPNPHPPGTSTSGFSSLCTCPLG
jgi:hypothetical protein